MTGARDLTNTTLRRGLAAALTAGLLATLVGSCSGSVSLGGDPSTDASPRGDLGKVRVAEESARTKYDRDQFGTRWKDIDGNGCDQRNDILTRDLDDVRHDGDCKVLTGVLDDPYTGERINFTRTRASQVQIDHLYPLALAWRMGADAWTPDKRAKFANDHVNLLAVGGTPNRQKSDKGPADWRPHEPFRCDYARRYTAVAVKYDLPVTSADRGALQTMLNTC